MKQSVILLLIFFVSKAQVLYIDRENGSDSALKSLYKSTTFNFSNDKQKNNLLTFTQNSEIAYISKSHLLFLLNLQNDLELNGLQYLENNGLFQIRMRDHDFRRCFTDFYIQTQWNGVWGLNYRHSIANNLRFRIQELKGLDAYLSAGIIYETEQWSSTGITFAYKSSLLPETVTRNLWRANFSAKTAFKFNSFSDLVCINHVQFPVNANFLNPRWICIFNWYVTVNDKLNFVIAYDHNYDAYRPLPIDVYYYGLSIGIQAKW